MQKQTHFFQTVILPLFSSGSHAIYDIPCAGPLKLLKLLVCTFLLRRSKEKICLLCTKVVTKKDFKRKLAKACLNLELMAGKEIAKVRF